MMAEREQEKKLNLEDLENSSRPRKRPRLANEPQLNTLSRDEKRTEIKKDVGETFQLSVTSLPSDVWQVILSKIKDEAKASWIPLQIHLVFLSSVSKRLAALCKAFKRQNKQDLQLRSRTGFTSYFALNGYLNCLVYAHENGCRWDESTCTSAAQNGHLDCLEYARNNGCQWTKETCSKAALNGHLNCLKYARSNGCPWDAETTRNAAYQGHLTCLRYAHENGCQWDTYTCANAALGGHLDCLKYCHENGCPWHEEWTCTGASLRGHLDCVTYAHEKGCPCKH